MTVTLVGTPACRARIFVKMWGGSAAGGAVGVSAESTAKKLICCGFPLSVRAKSSFLRSFTGCP